MNRDCSCCCCCCCWLLLLLLSPLNQERTDGQPQPLFQMLNCINKSLLSFYPWNQDLATSLATCQFRDEADGLLFVNFTHVVWWIHILHHCNRWEDGHTEEKEFWVKIHWMKSVAREEMREKSGAFWRLFFFRRKVEESQKEFTRTLQMATIQFVAICASTGTRGNKTNWGIQKRFRQLVWNGFLSFFFISFFPFLDAFSHP